MKSTKKLLISLVVLVIAFATTAATTFAWFTLNANPEIGGYDINVKTETDGLFLAVTSDYTATPGPYSVGLSANDFWKEIFYSEAQITALTAAEYYGKADAELSGKEKTDFNDGTVTKAEKETFLKAKLTNFKFDAFTPKQVNSGTTEAPKYDLDLAGGLALQAENGTAVGANNVTADNSGSYLKFTIHFRSTERYNILLNDATNNNAKKASVDAATTTDALPKLKFWDDFEANHFATNGLAVAKNDLISTRAANAVRIGFYNGTTANIWNPNYDKGYNSNTNNLANDYRNNLMSTSIDPTALVSEFTDMTQKLITLEENNGLYEGKMEVSVWLEGWDGDCLNSILKDIFTVNLVFKGVANPA